MASQWITAEEAQSRLGVKLQTLYAYTSRGLITNRADRADPRRSLYAVADIARLATRKARGRRATVAHEAMNFGEPVLASAVTTIVDGVLYYRGRDAIEFSRAATLEAAARVLWDAGEDNPFAELAPHPGVVHGPDAKSRMFTLLAQRAAQDPAMSGRSDAALRRETAGLLTDVVDAACGQVRGGRLHERLARSWRLEGAKTEAIRQALVLCADHELNASTFAARVAGSTGAGLAACALAGLATLSGPLHGGMTKEVADFIAEARRAPDPRSAARRRLSQGQRIPGFGHPLYPAGDPRARAMAETTPFSPDLLAIQDACESLTGKAANLDFALVAASRTIGLPVEAPFTIFSLGRTVGWIAHALEQRASGAGVIRPRARYVGLIPD